MLLYYHYIKSKNKVLYHNLAKKHNARVMKVYKLARGAEVKSISDYHIASDLIRKGIITGIV